MHMVIQAIVVATSKDAALNKARTVFEGLTGDGNPFDYYTMFDEEGSVVSGKGRYGNIPPVLKVNTKAGKAMIAWGFKATKDEFLKHMKRIRAGVTAWTDEAIMEELDIPGIPIEDTPYLVRHSMNCAGRYEGPSIWQYDQDGSGIRTQHTLDKVLDNYGDPLKKGEALYVVPADVHY